MPGGAAAERKRIKLLNTHLKNTSSQHIQIYSCPDDEAVILSLLITYSHSLRFLASCPSCNLAAANVLLLARIVFNIFIFV